MLYICSKKLENVGFYIIYMLIIFLINILTIIFDVIKELAYMSIANDNVNQINDITYYNDFGAHKQDKLSFNCDGHFSLCFPPPHMFFLGSLHIGVNSVEIVTSLIGPRNDLSRQTALK